ncbi:hypothetical protein [Psychromonas aquimarina]|uniref:hypothetical protein n=1 Tax=Psychromonas aquimarina TaxID=444919 RepID=UPI000426ADD6|nr:hypothetical protein [Psychromonas aquimarina]
MTIKYPVCPNCAYQRNEYDKLVHQAMCPACGIVYAKWQAPSDKSLSTEPPPDVDCSDQKDSFCARLLDVFFSVPEKVDSLAFYGRVIIFVLFFIWGCSFIFGERDWVSIGGSFLHNVNLPFHEFGHVIFRLLYSAER